MPAIIDIALDYIDRGWNPVRLGHKKKNPTADGWQLIVISDTNVHDHFNGRGDQNIGLMMGKTSRGLTDIDVDAPEALEVAPYLLPATPAMFGRASKRCAHMLYYTDLAARLDRAVEPFDDPIRLEEAKKNPSVKARMVELRTGGGGKAAQTMAPGSTHPDGEAVAWEHGCDGEPRTIDGEGLLHAVKEVAAAVLIVRYWPAARHNTALVLGGFLARCGMPEHHIKLFAESVAAAVGGDRKDTIRTAIDGAREFAAGKKAYGLTQLREMLGEKVANKCAEWLNYRSERKAEAPADQAPKQQTRQASNPTIAEALKIMTFLPIKYVVPGILVEGLTLLAGKPKIGKSWLLLHAAVAVACNGFTLGTTHCPEGDVLYCALEDNLRRLQSRLTKLLGIAQNWPARLEFQCEMPRLAEGGLAFIRNWIASKPHPRLVIIDTLAMVRAPKKRDDTNYADDYAAALELRALANETGVAIVLVHHLRKADSDDAFDTVSGTLGLTGAPDSILVLKRDTSGTIILHGRGRDLIEIEMAMTFDKESCLWRVAGDAAAVRRSTERAKVLEAVDEANDPIGPQDIAAATGMKAVNVRYLLGQLAKEGEIEKAGYGKYRRSGSVSVEVSVSTNPTHHSH
jgi:hypothetical protein